jgi:PAS domain-containing protein
LQGRRLIVFLKHARAAVEMPAAPSNRDCGNPRGVGDGAGCPDQVTHAPFRAPPSVAHPRDSFVHDLSAVFGGAYGFIAGSRSENSGYNPHTFALGASFLFALACVGLKLRKIALHNETLADRNWELQEAEQRARSLFESQGDLIVLRDAAGAITSSTTPIANWRNNREAR